MSFQVVLQYDVSSGFQDNTAVRDKVAGLTGLNVSETIDVLGFDRIGDMTVALGLSVRRTITLQTNALGNRLWTTTEQVKAITTRLFAGGLALLTPSQVTAAEPVVAVVNPGH